MTAGPADAMARAAPALDPRGAAELALAACPDGLIAFDHECRYTTWNAAMERLSGVDAADAIGRVAFELFPFLVETGEDRCFRDALEGREVSSSDRPFVIPTTGHSGFYAARYAPIRDSAGAVVGGVGIIRDVTDRVRAERESAEARARAERALRLQTLVLERMVEGVSVSDERGVIVYTNPSEDRMFGYEPGELVGRHVTALNAYPAEENARIVDEVIARLRAHGFWDGEWENVCKDGTPFVTHARITALELDGAPHWVCVQEDVTEQRRAARRQAFLDRASALLGASVAEEGTLAELLRQCVPELADYASIDLVTSEGTIRRVETVHVDPVKERVVRELWARYPYRIDEDLGVPAVLRTGEPLLVPEFTDEAIDAFVRDAEHRALLVAAGPRSYIAVPLAARGRTYGAISLVRADRDRGGSGQRYARADLELAAELARRVAGTIDNARAYAAEHAARQAAETASRRVALQYAVGQVLAGAEGFREAIPEVLRAVGEQLGWPFAACWCAAGGDESLRMSATWHDVADARGVDVVEATNRGLAFARGVGLVGRIWASGAPAWITRIGEDDNFPRKEVALAAGFTSAFGFPIRSADEVFGVVEIFHRQERAPDPALLQTVSSVGAQVGQFIERKRAERRLRGSESAQRAVLEAALDAVITMDGAGLVTEFNPAAERMFGYRRADVLGRALAELIIPPRLRAAHERGLARHLATGEARILGRRVELIGMRADGSEFPLELAIARVPGQVRPTFTGFLRDITERVRASEERERLLEAERLSRVEAERAREQAEHAERRVAFLAHASAALAASLDVEATLGAIARLAVPDLADWCFVEMLDESRIPRPSAVHHADPARVSLGWEVMTRYPIRRDEGVGSMRVARTGESALVPDLPDAALARMAHDASHLRILREAGFRSIVQVPLKVRRGADAAGEVIGVLTFATTDESGRRYDHADLAMAEEIAARAGVALENARLFEGERAARAEAEEARARAEEANRAKSEFLAVMSHELRTPLNAIGGYAELLEMGIRGSVTPAQAEDLQRIQRSQKHLLGLINEVLNYARVETGTVRYELADVDVGEIVVAVEMLVAPQLRAKGLAFAAECERGLVVRADREKLQQILVNLLTNAVKFTERGSVSLACESAGEWARLRVRDTGVGIPDDKLETIFEPFVQVDARLTRPNEGVGLGLAISRDLARGMGGDLTVESVPGEGSTFTLTLPRGEAARD